jgi:hypothetical protein
MSSIPVHGELYSMQQYVKKCNRNAGGDTTVVTVYYGVIYQYEINEILSKVALNTDSHDTH